MLADNRIVVETLENDVFTLFSRVFIFCDGG